MNKLKRNIARRRRLHNIAYFDCRKRQTLTDEQKQAVKALPINIEMLTKENRNDNKT